MMTSAELLPAAVLNRKAVVGKCRQFGTMWSNG
jgi:hypothetical protein